MNPEIDFYEGDVRNEDLLRNLLRRVDAVYHLAAYQDYLPDFARFSDVNVVSTSLIYQIIVADRLDLQRVVVASSQAAMGEGLYRCAEDGEKLPGMRSESDLAAGRWISPVRHVAARWRCRQPQSVLPTRRTPMACQSSARSWWP